MSNKNVPEELPRPLRVQCMDIIGSFDKKKKVHPDIISPHDSFVAGWEMFRMDKMSGIKVVDSDRLYIETIYQRVHKVLSHECGEEHLVPGPITKENFAEFVIDAEDPNLAIKAIEGAFACLDDIATQRPGSEIAIHFETSRDELNRRFHQHGVRYRYKSGRIVQVDSDWIHTKVVVPAMGLIANPKYAAANQEFDDALKHYHAGKNKECLNACGRAFESCLKIICDEQGWKYKKRAVVKDLLSIVKKHNLFPAGKVGDVVMRLMRNTIPQLRNELSGHGEAQNIEVPNYAAAYGLHLTASNIVLLVAAAAELK